MLAASVAGIAVYVGVLTMAPATSGAGQAGALRDALQAWVGVLEPTARLVAFGLRQLMLGPFADHVPRFAAEPFAAGAVLLATGWVVATPPRRRAQALACAALALACYGSIAMERVVFQPHLGARLAESEPYHYAATLPLTMRVALAVAAAACTRVRGRIALAAPGCWLLAWCAGHQLAGRRIPATWPSVSSRSRRANRSVAVAATQPVGADVYVRNEPFRGVGPLLVSAPLQFPA